MTDAARRLQKAYETLLFARHTLTGGYAAEAGRAAYMAAYHAAQAFIVSRTAKAPKTHSGVRSEFTRLAQAEPSIGRSHTAFLARAYELKAFADYDQAQPVSSATAEQAIDEAAEFVEIVGPLAGATQAVTLP